MTFDNFVTDPLDPYFALIVLGGIAVIGTAMLFFIRGFYIKRFGILVSLASFIVLAGSMLFAFHLQGISDDVKAQNRGVAEDNLKKKYDLVDVLWEEENTYPESYDLTNIVVQDQDNNILEFRYKIDPETKEPHLLNDSNDSRVKSNDLLRIQTS